MTNGVDRNVSPVAPSRLIRCIATGLRPVFDVITGGGTSDLMHTHIPHRGVPTCVPRCVVMRAWVRFRCVYARVIIALTVHKRGYGRVEVWVYERGICLV